MKFVAHSDLGVARIGWPDAISIADLQTVLSKIEKCLEVVGTRYGYVMTQMSGQTDAGRLLRYLRAGREEVARQLAIENQRFGM
jgi:hypothetical protein